MENGSSSQGYLGKRQYPHENVCWAGQEGWERFLCPGVARKKQSLQNKAHHCGGCLMAASVAQGHKAICPSPTGWYDTEPPKGVCFNFSPSRQVQYGCRIVIRLGCGKLCNLYCIPEFVGLGFRLAGVLAWRNRAQWESHRKASDVEGRSGPSRETSRQRQVLLRRQDWQCLLNGGRGLRKEGS